MPLSDFEQGAKEARLAATIEQHAKNLEAINGDIARSAAALESVVKEVHGLRVAFDTQVKTAKIVADALAAETESRRRAIAEERSSNTVRFTKFQQVAALAIGCVTVLITLYFATNPP